MRTRHTCAAIANIAIFTKLSIPILATRYPVFISNRTLRVVCESHLLCLVLPSMDRFGPIQTNLLKTSCEVCEDSWVGNNTRKEPVCRARRRESISKWEWPQKGGGSPACGGLGWRALRFCYWQVISQRCNGALEQGTKHRKMLGVLANEELG